MRKEAGKFTCKRTHRSSIIHCPRSILALLAAISFVAPAAAFAAASPPTTQRTEFWIQDNAATPTPFGGAVYAYVNGKWVRVDADKDVNVLKPDLKGAGFTRQDS